MHEIVKCSCGAVIRQCRCMNPNKTVSIIENGCDACQKRLIEYLLEHSNCGHTEARLTRYRSHE